LKARVLKIKAWDKTENLMVRISAVDCKRGVLNKKGYDIFLFTDTFDQNNTEIYDGDILLYSNNKYQVHWNDKLSRWEKRGLNNNADLNVLTPEFARKTLRLCHYHESEHSNK